MIVDTSALVAIARKEPDRDKYTLALELAGGGSMSAATYLETSIVIDHERDPILSRQLDDLIAAANIEIVPVTAHQARMARAAYRDFGKGSGHAARLNFGDCYSYALAKAVGEPLLFKGNDFSETDVADALDRPGE